jgi:PHP family Zn ribbon phosphoesterase
MDASHLVEEVMEVSSENMVFPAHAWTPWFSIFGAFSGSRALGRMDISEYSSSV